MFLSLTETMYSRKTKISVSVFDLNVIKITTTATLFWSIRTLVRNNNPAPILWLFTGKEHALGAFGRYYRYDILWKVTNSLYCNLINVGILQNRHNTAFYEVFLHIVGVDIFQIKLYFSKFPPQFQYLYFFSRARF